jgi:hypothetical protein
MLNQRPWYMTNTTFSIAKAYQRGMRIRYENTPTPVQRTDNACTTIQQKPITYFLLYPYS